MHTLAAWAVMVNTSTADHHIINDGKAALASNPFIATVLNAAVCQDRSLVESHASTMELLGYREIFWMEEFPAGSIHDFIGSMAKDVHNGIG